MSPPRLDARQQELATQHRTLAIGIARRMWRTRRHLPYEDFLSAADLGLVQAAHSYVPDPERPFPPYAACRVVGSVRDWLAHEARATTLRLAAHESAIAMAERIRDDDEGDGLVDEEPSETRQRISERAQAVRGAFLAGIAAQAQRPHGEDELIARGTKRFLIEAVRGAIASLPERDRTIIERHYFAGELLHAIGERLGVSYRSTRRFHQDALVRLSKRLTASGVGSSAP